MEANEKLEMLLEYSGMKILPFSSEDLKQLEKIKSQNGKTTEIYTIFKEKRELEELKKISFK